MLHSKLKRLAKDGGVKNQLSKGMINKKVMTILNKYHVDRSEVRVLSTPQSINLCGSLIKHDGSDLAVEALSNMVGEMTQIARVQSDLTNWDLNGGIRKIDDE